MRDLIIDALRPDRASVGGNARSCSPKRWGIAPGTGRGPTSGHRPGGDAAVIGCRPDSGSGRRRWDSSSSLDPEPAVMVGLAILAACPPSAVDDQNRRPKVGGGDAAFIASLHLCLAALAVVTVPAVFLTCWRFRWGSVRRSIRFSLLKILANTILLPPGLGLVVRALFPAWADAFRLDPRQGRQRGASLCCSDRSSWRLSILRCSPMDAHSYGVIAAVCVAALAIGHSCSGPTGRRGKRPSSPSSAPSGIRAWPSPSRPRTSRRSERCRCWCRAFSRSSSSRRLTCSGEAEADNWPKIARRPFRWRRSPTRRCSAMRAATSTRFFPRWTETPARSRM